MRSRQACVLGVLTILLAGKALAASDPIESFYAGKQVTLIVGGDAGGGYDALGRLLARHLGDHMAGHPLFVVQNEPAAGGIVSANELYNKAPRDGTVIGLLQRAMLTAHLSSPASARFDIAHFNWIGSLSTETSVTMAWHTSDIKTAKDLFSRQLIVGGQIGTDIGIAPQLYNAILGTKFKIVMGYTGTTDVALAMDRGEVQGLVEWSWASLKTQRPTWLRDHLVTLLMQGALQPNPEAGRLPMILDFARTDVDRKVLELYFAQKQAARPIVAPPGVPAERVAALRKAFMELATDQSFLDDANKSKLEVNLASGEAVEHVVKLIAATPANVAQRFQAAVAGQAK